MSTYIDTGETWHCQNIAIWHDGTLRPSKGHHGNCIWVFDGQFFVHQPHKDTK